MEDEKHDRLRVLVADDHDDVRRALVKLLRTDFDVVGEASTGVEVVRAAQTLCPDVIVSDLTMPLLNGLQAMKELHDAGHPVPFVLVTTDARDAHRWLAMGASGVVDKSDLELDLLPAVRAAASGQTHLSRRVRRF